MAVSNLSLLIPFVVFDKKVTLGGYKKVLIWSPLCWFAFWIINTKYESWLLAVNKSFKWSKLSEAITVYSNASKDV